MVEIQRVFFNFMLRLVNDFTQFFRKESLTESMKHRKFEIDEVFDKEAYLKMFPLEDKAFMREIICNTMVSAAED